MFSHFYYVQFVIYLGVYCQEKKVGDICSYNPAVLYPLELVLNNFIQNDLSRKDGSCCEKSLVLYDNRHDPAGALQAHCEILYCSISGV